MNAQQVAMCDEWRVLNNVNNFTTQSYIFFINNLRKVLMTKGRLEFDGLPIENWYMLMYQRMGNEPIVRLLWRCMFAMMQENIRIDEVLAIDPILYIECMEQGSMVPYYQIYPQNMQH